MPTMKILCAKTKIGSSFFFVCVCNDALATKLHNYISKWRHDLVFLSAVLRSFVRTPARLLSLSVFIRLFLQYSLDRNP